MGWYNNTQNKDVLLSHTRCYLFTMDVCGNQAGKSYITFWTLNGAFNLFSTSMVVEGRRRKIQQCRIWSGIFNLTNIWQTLTPSEKCQPAHSGRSRVQTSKKKRPSTQEQLLHPDVRQRCPASERTSHIASPMKNKISDDGTTCCYPLMDCIGTTWMNLYLGECEEGLSPNTRVMIHSESSWFWVLTWLTRGMLLWKQKTLWNPYLLVSRSEASQDTQP